MAREHAQWVEKTAKPKIVSAGEWQWERDELLTAENEATRALDALAARRRRLPMVRLRNDWPGQARQPEPGLYRRDHAVRAHDDGQRGVGRQGPQAAGRSVADETDVDPVGVWAGAGLSRGSGLGCGADPHQDQAVPAAEVRQRGVGAPRGQHGGASG